jgi:hypothetical protein
LILVDAEPILSQAQHKVQHDVFSGFLLFTMSLKLALGEMKSKKTKEGLDYEGFLE